ncbi:WD repeat-containing protein 91 [Saguinus oedipus]|uniref:WD repeat-containing protein 91 n=1 Tax=Saguinus oedipus TaxID=9490 RepID=A0ABQ9UIR5_SAGOE|nr:WD repeat-containing protein 91 [Saguinus oedipus]
MVLQDENLDKIVLEELRGGGGKSTECILAPYLHLHLWLDCRHCDWVTAWYVNRAVSSSSMKTTDNNPKNPLFTHTQATKGKDPMSGAKDGKSLLSGLATGESGWSQHRQRRLQDHGKERKELFSTTTSQCAEKKPEASGPEAEPCPELHVEPVEPLTRASSAGLEGGGVRPEQPFIVLGQEEYGEHHSSIMHCRVDCSGRRVASLDVDGVIKVWSFNPIMQTKASSISKSPLLSLEWATKRDRLLLLGSGVGTVRLYDTEAKKNLCEISINDDMPSPNGASFVCSAAAPSLTSQVDFSAPDIGSKGMNQVPGRLLLWDTKTMKQQVRACPVAPPGFSLDPEPIAINCTAFNHNGNLLVTGAADGVIRLFGMQMSSPQGLLSLTSDLVKDAASEAQRCCSDAPQKQPDLLGRGSFMALVGSWVPLASRIAISLSRGGGGLLLQADAFCRALVRM